MIGLLKNIISRLKNIQSSISFNSRVSLNTIIGKKNTIINSNVYNSTLQNNSYVKGASLYSSFLGDNCKIELSSLYSGRISNNVSIGSNTIISGSSIGRYTYLAGNNRAFNATIGAFCSIAENVSIGHAEHPYIHFSTSPVFYKKANPFETTKFMKTEINEFKETVIGNDVWIGLNAYIRSGVVVGDGAIIGVASVVTKDVPPYSIVGGIPAKVMKMRFDEEMISKLKKDCWWDLSDDELIKYTQKNWE